MNPTASPRRKFGWASLVALALVPLLAVAALIGLAWSSESDVKAAVVNLDEAVTVEGQLVPLGRQLAAAMIDKDGENISWTLADAPSAAAGLKSGQYSAVVTIPRASRPRPPPSRPTTPPPPSRRRSTSRSATTRR